MKTALMNYLKLPFNLLKGMIEMDHEVIIGRNPVMEALQSGRSIKEVLLSQQLNKKTENKFKQAIKRVNVQVRKVPKHVLDELTTGNHQGIVAYVAPYEYASIEDLFNRAQERNEEPFFVILDELEDPHNLGSILRTADAAGVHGVIIPRRRAVGLTAAVAKTSAGAIEYVPVVQVTNVVDTMKELKERNVWIVGTDAEGSEDYRSLDGATPIALVIGNEGRGMSRLVKETCDWTVHLPMKGQVSSLNASVACSLLMYEIYRKRNPLGE